MALNCEVLSIHNLSQFEKAWAQYGPLASYCIKHLSIQIKEANWTYADYKTVVKTYLNLSQYLQLKIYFHSCVGTDLKN